MSTNGLFKPKKGKDNPYRDYYIWADPAADGGVPNGLRSTFSGPAWTLDEESGQYYLHQFSRKQPDLNWENPKVRQEIYDMINFWIKKGVGGFRLDVIDLIGKEPLKMITNNGPKLHDYLQEMNHETYGNSDLLTVGETWGATPEIAMLYSDPERNELSMVFQFEHVSLDQQPGKDKWDLKELDIRELKEVMTKWQTSLGDKGWNSLFWNNHDLPRIVSRWGNDGKYREKSAKAFAILLHMMKGTPYIYQGEEIALTNTPITDIQQADDIESINLYNERLEQGYLSEDILTSINAKGRDNARRPMPWDSSSNGGFTSGTPWLALNPHFEEINVADALARESSIFYTYQRLIQLRKASPIIVWGDFHLLDTAEKVFAYTRSYQNQQWLIVVNLSDQEQTFQLEQDYDEVVISNLEHVPGNLREGVSLSAWDSFVVKLASKSSLV